MKKTAGKNRAVPSMDGEHDWQAEDDLRTLTRAHEIKRDKKRHGRAKAKAKEKLAQLRAVQQEQPQAAQPVNDGDGDEGA